MQPLNNFIILKKEKIKEKKTEGGIIIYNEYFESQEYTKKNIKYFEIVSVNKKEVFLKAGDRAIINPEMGAYFEVDGQDYKIIMSHQYLAKVDKAGCIVVPPNKVMIRIKKEDRESVFSKSIVRDDGTKVDLVISTEPDDESDQRNSQLYVSTGEVVDYGSEVKDIEIGDTAMIDYLVDNDIDNVVAYEQNGDKLVIVDAITTYHDKDEWLYASRKEVMNPTTKRMQRVQPRDTLLTKSGDFDIISPLLGVIRGNKLISRSPYCFLEHAPETVSKVSKSGVLFTETEQVLERKILSVDTESTKRFGIYSGETVLIKNEDVFDCRLNDGGLVQCAYDSDVMMGI